MKHLLRIKTFLAPYWLQTAFALLTLLTVSAIEMVLPQIIRQVIDTGLGTGRTVLLIAALLILGLGLAKSVLNYYQRFLAERIAQNIAFDLRNQLYNHIQNLPFTFHDHTQSGQLISRVIEDVRSVQSFAGRGFIELAHMLVLIVATAAIMVNENIRLALISMMPIIPLIWLTVDYGNRIGKLYFTVDNFLGDLSSRLQENVTGVQVVRAFAREPYEIERFKQTNRGLFAAQIRVVREWSRIMPTTNLLIAIGTILILWFGGNMALAGEISIGELVAFNSYMLLLASPAQQLGNLVDNAGEASAGLQRTLEILDHKSEIQSPPDAITLPTLRGQVEFKHVDLQYAGENITALKDIDLQIEPNQIVALIGLTGSGKTSLVNLVPRFYDPTYGSVYVDGVDIRQVNLKSLRNQIGIVLQTSLLFSATIRENLAYGRPDAPEEAIIAAAKAAQAHDFIRAMPQGYDTAVGERGVTLSGGQRQRIAIGRALLMDPRILILDDSTSSVDTQTEYLIQRAMSTLMKGRTTFVIAQRLSTVRHADLILVMDQGSIVARGKHADLLESNDLYRQIYELQLRDQESFQDEEFPAREAGTPLEALPSPKEMEDKPE